MTSIALGLNLDLARDRGPDTSKVLATGSVTVVVSGDGKPTFNHSRVMSPSISSEEYKGDELCKYMCTRSLG